MNYLRLFIAIPLVTVVLFPACSDLGDEVIVATTGAGGATSSSSGDMGGDAGAPMTTCPQLAAKPLWQKEWPFVMPDIDWSPGFPGFVFNAAGESFSAGAFEGLLDWQSPPLSSSDSWYDVAVAKFDPLGNVLWTRRHSGHQLDFGLIPMSDGGVVLFGSFWGPVDYGGGPIESEQGWFDEVIARFDAQGDHLWSRRTRLAGSGEGHLLDVARGPQDSLVVVGYYRGGVDLGTGFISTPMDPNGGWDMDGFVLEMDSAGNSSWLRTYTGPGMQRIQQVSVNPAGTIGITGTFDQHIDWGDGPIVPAEPWDREDFVAQLDSDGNHIFGHVLEVPDVPTTTTDSQDILVRPDATTFVLVSTGPDPVSSGYQSYLQKWSPNGQLEWMVHEGKKLSADASIRFSHFPPIQPDNGIATVVSTQGLVDLGLGSCDEPQWFLLTHGDGGKLSNARPWHWSNTQGADGRMAACTSSPTPCGDVSCPGCSACCVFMLEP